MGSNVSKTTNNDLIKNTLDVFTKHTTSCSSSTNMSQTLVVNTSGCSDVNISGINFKQQSNVDFKCLTNNDTQTRMKSEFDKVKDRFIKQHAGLFSSNVTKEFNTLSVDMSKRIQDIIENNVSIYSGLQQKITINAEDVKGGKCEFTNIELNQVNKVVSENVFSDTKIMDMQTKMDSLTSTTIKQSAGNDIMIIIIAAIIIYIAYTIFFKDNPGVTIIKGAGKMLENTGKMLTGKS